ncbi:MAG: hypothetical protein DCC75_00715 [Proteobacteria bacterium]|nr:MAG: hypothetical protein DCC75_00715 [Pseudomonadota bacterium]
MRHFILLLTLLPHILLAESPPPFTGGLLLELTGASSPNGQACKVGFDAAQKHLAPGGKVAGRQVRLVYGDSQREARVGLSEFRKLVDIDGAGFVVTLSSPVCMAVNPVSKQKGVPVFGIAGQADFVRENPYAFRFWLSAQAEGRAHAERLFSDGKRKAAVVTLEDDWTLSVSDSFKHRFLELGGEIVSDLEIPPASYEPAVIFTKVKAAAPQAIFVNLGIPQLGSAFRKIHELGISSTVHSNAWAQLSAVKEVAGAEAISGVVVTMPKAPQRFLEMLGESAADPSTRPLALTCYCALGTALKVLEENPGIKNAADFQRAMEGVKKIAIPGVELDFRDREAQYEVEFYRIEGSLP